MSISDPTKDSFASIKEPTIGIKKYLLRFMTHLEFAEESVYILMLLYLNKYLKNEPEVYLTSLNVHRLLASCVLLAYKFQCDRCLNNKLIALIAGMPTSELNQLEFLIFKGLDFKLLVSVDDYDACYQSVLQYQCP